MTPRRHPIRRPNSPRAFNQSTYAIRRGPAAQGSPTLGSFTSRAYLNNSKNATIANTTNTTYNIKNANTTNSDVILRIVYFDFEGRPGFQSLHPCFQTLPP